MCKKKFGYFARNDYFCTKDTKNRWTDMTYLNPFHKAKTERCLKKMQSWHTSQMTYEEQLKIADRMKANLALAETM